MKIKALVLYNSKDPEARQMRGVYLLNERDHSAAFGASDVASDWNNLIVKCLEQWYRSTMNTQHDDSDAAIDYGVRMDMPEISYFWMDPTVAIRLITELTNQTVWLNVCRRFEVDKYHFVDSLHVAGYHTASKMVKKPSIICPNCLNMTSFILQGKPIVSFSVFIIDGVRKLDPPEVLESVDETNIVNVICCNCDYSADTNSFAMDI